MLRLYLWKTKSGSEYTANTSLAFRIIAVKTALDKQSVPMEVSVLLAQHLLQSVIYPSICSPALLS